MNVAILSSARKTWLVRAFQKGLAACGGGTVYACDNDPVAAALLMADRPVLCPRSDEEHFENWLLDFCRHEMIRLLVPTRDEELQIVAKLAERLKAIGTLAAVSPLGSISVCQDKRRFIDFCKKNGFDVPGEISDTSDPNLFPAFIKPRWGKSGKGAQQVDSQEVLHRIGFDPAGFILQELVTEPEFTIDVFTDFRGIVLSSIPRERIRVSSGESVVSRTVRDPELEMASARLVKGLDLRGHVTVQAFRGAHRIRFIEVNPRFGGGAALGFAAGCPTPEWLIRQSRGESIPSKIGLFTANLWCFRHSTDTFLTQEALPPHARRAL